MEGKCEDCRECSESDIAYSILDSMYSADHQTVKAFEESDTETTTLRELLMYATSFFLDNQEVVCVLFRQFAMEFLHSEICYAPDCHTENPFGDMCNPELCEWHCEAHYDPFGRSSIVSAFLTDQLLCFLSRRTILND